MVITETQATQTSRAAVSVQNIEDQVVSLKVDTNPFIDIFQRSLSVEQFIPSSIIVAQHQRLAGLLNTNTDLNGNLHPCFFDGEKIYKERENLTAFYLHLRNFILANSNNAPARIFFSLSCMCMAHIYSKKYNYFVSQNPAAAQKLGVQLAQYVEGMEFEVGEAKKGSTYFHPMTHFMDYLVRNYKGIDCGDMVQVRDALFALNRAKSLLKSYPEQKFMITQATIDNEVTRLFASVNTCALAHNLSEEDMAQVSLQMNSYLQMDPFAEDFKAKPALLAQAKTIPALVENHGPIIIPFENYSAQYIKDFLLYSRGTLGRTVYLTNPEFKLTQEIIDILMDELIVNPKLIIAFNNQEFASLLLNSCKNNPQFSSSIKSVTFTHEDIPNCHFFVLDFNDKIDALAKFYKTLLVKA